MSSWEQSTPSITCAERPPCNHQSIGLSPSPGLPADTPPPYIVSERPIRCLSCFATRSAAAAAPAKTLPGEMPFGQKQPVKADLLNQVSTGLDQAPLQICQRPVSNFVRYSKRRKTFHKSYAITPNHKRTSFPRNRRQERRLEFTTSLLALIHCCGAVPRILAGHHEAYLGKQPPHETRPFSRLDASSSSRPLDCREGIGWPSGPRVMLNIEFSSGDRS